VAKKQPKNQKKISCDMLFSDMRVGGTERVDMGWSGVAGDARQGNDSARDLLISADLPHASASGLSLRSVDGRLSDLVALLAKGAEDFSLAIEELSQAGQLSPSVRAAVTSIKSYAQAIVEVADIRSADGVRKPQVRTEPKGVPMETPAQGRDRRPSSKAFDFLLLEALHVRPRLSVPVGLGDLKQIAKAFDENVKPTSLVAKLNRWKNDDALLEWTSHEDMHLTPQGIARRTELLPLARKTGRLDAVNDAIFAVLGVRSSY
jgi:hypothetical protein